MISTIGGPESITTQQFKAHAALFWKVGIITEEQFDALMAESNVHAGKTFSHMVIQIEEELRK